MVMMDTWKVLSKLDDNKHSKEEIRALIDSDPDVLSVKDENDLVAIQKAAYDYDTATGTLYTRSISFVPLLAWESAKLNVFEDEMQGGLLCQNKSGNNVLHHLAWGGGGDSEEYAASCFGAIKRLWDIGFLRKEDIQKYDLLWLSLSTDSCMFHFLADCNPDALKELVTRKKSFFIRRNRVEIFQMVLSAAMRISPENLGHLFLSDSKGRSTMSIARRVFGWKTIEHSVDQTTRRSDCTQTLETAQLQLMHAAENECLDMTFYLIRRDPVTLCSIERCINSTLTIAPHRMMF